MRTRYNISQILKSASSIDSNIDTDHEEWNGPSSLSVVFNRAVCRLNIAFALLVDTTIGRVSQRAGIFAAMLETMNLLLLNHLSQFKVITTGRYERNGKWFVQVGSERRDRVHLNISSDYYTCLIGFTSKSRYMISNVHLRGILFGYGRGFRNRVRCAFREWGRLFWCLNRLVLNR